MNMQFDAIWKLGRLSAAAIIVFAGLSTAGLAQSRTEAWRMFMSQDFTGAANMYAQLLRAAPTNDTLWAEYARCLRYRDRDSSMDSAVLAARRALGLAPCNAAAHEVLGDCYNPQYTNWTEANRDSAWRHMNEAVRCNPHQDGAWMSIWAAALMMRDTAFSDTALARLMEHRFFPRSMINYYHWTLRSVPERALVAVSGDSPTYLLNALQRLQRLRPDVAIVNHTMLQMPAYARMMRDRYGLELPLGDSALRAFTYETVPAQLRRNGNAATINLSEKIVLHWLALARTGALGRPLVVVGSLTEAVWTRTGDRFINMGPYYAHTRLREGPSLDTAAVRRNLALIDPKDYGGPAVSPNDLSPYRASQISPACLLGFTAAEYTQFMLDSRKRRDAEWGLQLMTALDAQCGTHEGLRRWIEAARKQLRGKRQR